jgi:hypothetical protein
MPCMILMIHDLHPSLHTRCQQQSSQLLPISLYAMYDTHAAALQQHSLCEGLTHMLWSSPPDVIIQHVIIPVMTTRASTRRLQPLLPPCQADTPAKMQAKDIHTSLPYRQTQTNPDAPSLCKQPGGHTSTRESPADLLKKGHLLKARKQTTLSTPCPPLRLYTCIPPPHPHPPPLPPSPASILPNKPTSKQRGCITSVCPSPPRHEMSEAPHLSEAPSE